MASVPFPGSWPPDVQFSGNSEYIYQQNGSGATIWLVAEAVGTGAALYQSTNYGASFTHMATIPEVGVGIAFDPAIAIDSSGVLHIVGQALNSDPVASAGHVTLVKFTYTPSTSTLSSPVMVSITSILGSDYDIVPLANGNTYVVTSQLVATAETLEGIEIEPDGTIAVVDTLYAAEGLLAGLRHGAVSLWTADGVNVEIYLCAVPKAFTFSDVPATMLSLVRSAPNTVSAPTTLTTFMLRYESNKLTVIGVGESRYLVHGFYRQSGSSLMGNFILGFRALPYTPWVFQTTLGSVASSYLEPTLVLSPSGPVLGVIMGSAASLTTVGLPVFLYNVNPFTLGLTPRTDFPYTVAASWLRGTKSLVSPDMAWGFLAQSPNGVARFYTGFPVPPVVILTPTSVTGNRGVTYTFDASQSYSPNMRTLEFTWSIISSTGTVVLTPDGDTATVEVPLTSTPGEDTIILQVAVVDVDSTDHPLHSPVVAVATLTFPAITAPVIGAFGPVDAARNSTVTLSPTITVSPYVNPSYAWSQTSGTVVTLLSATTGPTLMLNTGGAALAGETLVFQLTVNDGVNPPESANFEVIVAARASTGETQVLSRATYSGAIVARNQVGTWSSFTAGTETTGFTSSKRFPMIPENYPSNPNYLSGFPVSAEWTNTAAQQAGSYLLIGPASVVVERYGATWKLVTPNPTDTILDAVHAYLDETLILTSAQALMRFVPTNPVADTDYPAQTIALSNYTSKTFSQMLATPPFAGKRVIAFLGPEGILLLQINRSFKVTGFFTLLAGAGVLYGSSSVVWTRMVDVEDLHSGTLFIGTADGAGNYFETEYSLAIRSVIGVLDASDLKNKTPTTGELLFASVDPYSGIPLPPVLSAQRLPSGSLALTWAQDRPDLASGYEVCLSLNGGTFASYNSIGSGYITATTVYPPIYTGTIAVCVVTRSADGDSAPSNAISFTL